MRIEEAIKQDHFESPRHKALLNLLYTASWMKLNISQNFKPFGLTQEQFNVLRILRGQKGKAISLKEVTQRMLDKSSNTSRIVDRLKRKGLVTRSECTEDRRLVDLVITEMGLDLLKEMDKTDAANTFPLNLTDDEAVLLSSMLDKARGELAEKNNVD